MRLALFGAALALGLACLPAHAQGGRYAFCEQKLEAETPFAGMRKGQRIKRSQKLARCMERGGNRGEGRGMRGRRGGMMPSGSRHGMMRGDVRPGWMGQRPHGRQMTGRRGSGMKGR